jgi:DNA-binding transcriptional ArsR family regulator
MAMLTQNDAIFQALGRPVCRLIFAVLQKGPLPVNDVTRAAGVSRQSVTRHLALLRQAKLIKMRYVRTQNICELDGDGILYMQTFLENILRQCISSVTRPAGRFCQNLSVNLFAC